MSVRVRWGVSQFTSISGYNQFKVYRSDTEGGAYVEVTAVGTRIAIVATQDVYFFDDSGDTSKWYKITLYDSVGDAEGASTTPAQYYSPQLYASLEEVRAAGITVTQAANATVNKAIKTWSQFIDRACRQWFEPRYIDDAKLDGNGRRILWLMAPIIDIEALYMNGDWDTAVETAAYEVYNNLGYGLKDDRRNPKIAISDEYASTNLYRRLAYGSDFAFASGRKNQWIVGTFGFVELDGSVPGKIQRAVLKMVVKELGSASPLSPAPTPAGPLIGETTDGHTVRYASMVGGRKIGTIGITGDSEVEGIIQLYRAPRATAVSSDA